MDIRIQQDAQEFLTNLCDKLEEQLKHDPQENMIQYFFGSLHVSQFFGQGTCSHYHERCEPHLCFTLEVRGNNSLEESFEAWTRSEHIDDYSCDKCNAKTTIRKRTCVKSLPRVMIVHLKRFEFNFERMEREKVNDFLSFPDILDMEPYTKRGLEKREGQVHTLTDDDNDNDDDVNGLDISQAESKKYAWAQPEDAQTHYKLVGVVNHRGSHQSGHYTSFVKERFSPNKT